VSVAQEIGSVNDAMMPRIAGFHIHARVDWYHIRRAMNTYHYRMIFAEVSSALMALQVGVWDFSKTIVRVGAPEYQTIFPVGFVAFPFLISLELLPRLVFTIQSIRQLSCLCPTSYVRRGGMNE
jgi:hypothetical protein